MEPARMMTSALEGQAQSTSHQFPVTSLPSWKLTVSSPRSLPVTLGQKTLKLLQGSTPTKSKSVQGCQNKQRLDRKHRALAMA